MFMTTPVHSPVAELTRHADKALERFQGTGPLSGYTFDRKKMSLIRSCVVAKLMILGLWRLRQDQGFKVILVRLR